MRRSDRAGRTYYNQRRCTSAESGGGFTRNGSLTYASYTFEAAPAEGAEELSPPRKSPSSPTLALFGSCGSQSHSSRQRCGRCAARDVAGRR